MKETYYKLKHRVTALFAAAKMLCSMLPGAAFARGTHTAAHRGNRADRAADRAV